MKEAKKEFDDLAARMEDGKTISFGEMERVYAQAFLGRFFEHIAAEASREDSHNCVNNRSSLHCITSRTMSTNPILKNSRNFCPLPYFPIYWRNQYL